MTNTELINRIASDLEIPKDEQKLFFEMLLERCAAELNSGEQLSFPGLGKFEYRKAVNANESDLILFITDAEELFFHIPQNQKEDSPIDSYFSISIGKPVIPLKGAVENKFFLPQSGDEKKRFLELKVEQFMEKAVKAGTESEEEEKENIIPEIQFSFLNWKKSSGADEENQEEQDISFSSEVVKEVDKIEDVNEIEPLNIEGKENDISEVTIDKVTEDIINENTEEKISEMKKNKPVSSIEGINKKDSFVPVNKEITHSDEYAISEAFKYAEKRNARFERDRKRSRAGFVFAGIIFLATAAIIYFTYYFPASEKLPVTLHSAELKDFKVTIERSYDIPVSYPYQKGMFAGVYKAINDDIFKPIIEKSSPELITETTVNVTSKVPEIRDAQSSNRIKGYIYQYNDENFAVQISSWKSKSIAISETQKYLDAGYDAFIEQTELSGSRYYRVRVGSFKTIEEVELFLKSKK